MGEIQLDYRINILLIIPEKYTYIFDQTTELTSSS